MILNQKIVFLMRKAKKNWQAFRLIIVIIRIKMMKTPKLSPLAEELKEENIKDQHSTRVEMQKKKMKRLLLKIKTKLNLINSKRNSSNNT